MVKKELYEAYRRVKIRSRILSTCIEIVGYIALVYLQIIFGIILELGEYTSIGRSSIDLGNEILKDDTWDPNTMHSPQQNIICESEFLPNFIPLAPEDDLEVDLESTKSLTGRFINDLIKITLEYPS